MLSKKKSVVFFSLKGLDEEVCVFQVFVIEGFWLLVLLLQCYLQKGLRSAAHLYLLNCQLDEL